MNLLFLLLSLSSCSTFYVGPRHEPTTAPFPPFKILSYELFGWEDEEDRKKAGEILKALVQTKTAQLLKYKSQNTSEWHLQIILESSPKFRMYLGEQREPSSRLLTREPLRFLLYGVNRLLAVSTVLLIPIVNRDDDAIVFRLYQNNHIVREKRVMVESYQIIGWISLFAKWIDDGEKWDSIFNDLILAERRHWQNERISE
ncbi:hypothetical protein [Leptospira ryugenii]|uniref:hypothetical protein n=1 Tax=Leptospira ryugenii TaxID=1917863 RepID=UPI000D59F4A9|nr:hypothetical protein [Leptospira ryugenii]